MKNKEIFLADIKILNKGLNQSFTYMIDFSLYNILKFTDLVLIEFNNKLEIGMVLDKKVQEEAVSFNIKPIYKILKQNRISNHQLELVDYLDTKLYANKEDLINLILKKNSINTNKLEIKITKNNELTKEMKQNYENKDQKIIYKSLTKELKKESINLLKANYIDVRLLEEKVTKVNVFKLKEKELKQNNLKLNSKILDRYLTKKNLLKYYEINTYMYNKMKNLNILAIKTISKVDYEPLEEKKELRDVYLTPKQTEAYGKIVESINQTPVLLHGVTGSGKTAIFTKIIEEVLIKNKQVLILVPEITLTVQMVEHLTEYFGELCAFFNTSLTKNEHNNLLTKIKNNTVKIIISTRSGVYLDIPNLALVIVDEEHDASYKQNFYPYYHVDDMIEYWQNKKINVLYSSATPRLLTYAKAQKKVFSLVELNARYNDYTLPEIILKNYDQENIIDEEFINIIKNQINKKQNVLILFNVKGYSKSIECPNCGNVEKCPNCNLPMKYFKKSRSIECSYCEHKQTNYTRCSKCNNPKLKLIGLGIEKIQEDIQKHFNKKILRIDSQVAKTKQKVNQIIKEFNSSSGNILIGTQIVAKGLNFNKLNQVMVLNTDNMLYFNDFSSYEVAYQLLEQVSGRSGRTKEEGKVYIYTNHQDNFIYQAVKKHDYQAFYKEEMKNRKLQKSIPYYYICQIEFRHKNVMKYEEQIEMLRLKLDQKGIITTKIVDPYLETIGEDKRLKLYIKYKKENIKEILRESLEEIDFGTCKVLVDLTIMNYGF